MSIDYNGRTLETDKDGFLQDMSQWSPELAEFMASKDDLELTSEHWEVINYIREYYEDYRIAPAVRILIKAMGRRLDRDKANSRYLYKLFPYGPAKQACRYAGLPKPTGCV